VSILRDVGGDLGPVPAIDTRCPLIDDGGRDAVADEGVGLAEHLGRLGRGRKVLDGVVLLGAGQFGGKRGQPNQPLSTTPGPATGAPAGDETDQAIRRRQVRLGPIRLGGAGLKHGATFRFR
jgi:hypothetical protein